MAMRDPWRAAAAILVAAAVLIGAGAAAPASRASAQEAITVISDQARNEFPAGVTFSVTFSSPAPVREVRLRYEVAPDGTGASAVANCTGTGTVNCTYTLVSGRGIFIIPGAQITYHWDIEDEKGDKLSTSDILYSHEDTRFDFRPLADGNVTVYYHGATEGDAPAVLQAAIETLDRIGKLEGAQVGFPVKVFLYSTADEMQPAIISGNGQGVQILGEVFYSDTAMVSADQNTVDITRHEVAHIVTREATKGPFGIPDWMNEGISVFAQSRPLSGHGDAVDAAIRGDRVLTMGQLNSSATGGVSSTVSLYYGQAGSMVRFLVETYGEAKFAELLKTFKDGATDDDAYQNVYGFDALGYENAWRTSVGLEPRVASSTPTPEPTDEVRAQPTSSGNGNGGQAAGDDGGDDGVPVAMLAAVIVLAVGGAGATMLLLKTARERL